MTASLVCDENADSLPQIIDLGIPSFSSCRTCLTPPHALRLSCIEKFPRTREAIRLRPKGERLGHFIRNRLWTDRKNQGVICLGIEIEGTPRVPRPHQFHARLERSENSRHSQKGMHIPHRPSRHAPRTHIRPGVQTQSKWLNSLSSKLLISIAMHSTIFQIAEQPIGTDEYVGIDHVEAGEMTSIDYCREVSQSESQTYQDSCSPHSSGRYVQRQSRWRDADLQGRFH